MADDKRGQIVAAVKAAPMTPRSPSEALAPTRAPARPRRSKVRREPRRLSPALRVFNGVLTFLAITLALAGAMTFWMSAELAKPGPTTEAKAFVVRKGDGSREIARRLEQDGIIESEHVFVMHYVGRGLASWLGSKPLQLKAGEYEFPPAASIRQVAEIIGEGRSVLYRLSMPEGLTSWQIAERLKADSALTGEIAKVPPEGSMLPETFKVPRNATRQSILDMMQAEQRKLVESLWESRQADLPYKTIEEAITLASIVERETGRNDKHADIAAVFVNRLKRGMPLQSDPTILYGLAGGQVAWGKPILKTEIQSRTAYNTYVIKGLPPGPICNPSRNSLQAALNPSQSAHLYFVAGGNGASVFSHTLEEHNAAVAQWRKIEQGIRAKQAENAQAKAAAAAAAGAAQPTAEAEQATAPAAAAAVAVPAAPQQAAAPALTPASADVPLPIRKPKK